MIGCRGCCLLVRMYVLRCVKFVCDGMLEVMRGIFTLQMCVVMICEERLVRCSQTIFENKI